MNTAYRLIIPCVFLFVSAIESRGSVVLTSFGNSASPAFMIDGSTSFTTTQNAANIGILGADSLQLAGTFDARDLTGQSDVLTLTGSVLVGSTSGFNAELVDGSGNFALYTGGIWLGPTGLASGSTVLSFLSSDPLFNFADVIGIQLLGGGAGISSINATLTGASTSAIPEPSRVMLLLLGFFGLTLKRNRAIRA